MGERTNDRFQTESGIPLKKVYGPADIADLDYVRDLGLPGEAPYTRGVYPGMYRERLWRIFQLSGTGAAEDERERIKYLLEQGETGFIMESDMSSWLSYDVDHPEVLCRKGDVGFFGAPLNSLRDYEIALEGIPIEKLYCHPSAITPIQAPFATACYFALAEKRGIPWSQLSGTGEAGMMLQYLGHPSKHLIPPRYAVRLNCDLIEFCVTRLPRWVPLSIEGYNSRENGINAYQELAMVLANAIAYIDTILSRGRLGIDDFAHAIAGVNFALGRDFFENIAQVRAVRRMWHKLLTERYQAQDPRSLRLRIHSLTQGSHWTYEQPLNNIIRGTYRALSAALGGVQSLGVSAYDEALATPSEEAHVLSIRTQQILQFESNVTSVVDPLAGSYYVEWLTNEMEKLGWDYLKRIEELGGYVSVLDSGWAHREATKGAMGWEKKIASGETKVVGLNCFRMDKELHTVSPFRPNPKAWEISMARLEQIRRERDSKKVEQGLDELRRVAETEENVMPAVMNVAKAYGTIGEVGKVWREVFGTWNVPTLF